MKSATIKAVLSIIFFTSGLLFSGAAHAQYPTAARNSLLREEVSGDDNRLIPVTQHFAFAGDGQGYYRLLGPQDFYHGIGYWLQVRSEVKPTHSLRLNMRSVFFAGSASNGYAEPTGQYNLLAITGIWPEPFYSGFFRGRILDLGRQTIGLGLMIQDKEFNGGLLQWANESHSITFMADGTGALLLNDDTYNIETRLFKGLAGFGAVIWPMGVEQDFLEKDRDPLIYLYSTQAFDFFSYGVELGERAGSRAGLAFISTKKILGPVQAESKIQVRRYEENFGNNFVGTIENLYVSYDQYDKDYTNAINIFVKDDNVDVRSVHFNLYWNPSHFWRLHSLNELGVFDYQDTNDESYYFYRHGLQHCPIKNRDDCFSFFFSNKVLMDGFAKPPNQVSRSNESLFKESPFAGFEASFRF